MQPKNLNAAPGIEHTMDPKPCYIRSEYKGTGKLAGKVALVTGGDSGIGRAVAAHFAAEGANVVINYLSDAEILDVEETLSCIRFYGAEGLALQGDLRNPSTSKNLVETTLLQFGHLDILVNNAAEQTVSASIAEIDSSQLESTFETNFFAAVFLIQAAIPHLKPGSRIINTTSMTAHIGNSVLVDYASSKGALEGLTICLADHLKDRSITVNAVVPGPVWTPLIAKCFASDELENFGKDVPIGRPGQPCEVAPAYVFLASNASNNLTGQFIHPNGGVIVGS